MRERSGGGGKTLSYIATHDAIRTANDIFGPGGWGHEVVELVCLGEEGTENRSGKKGVRVGYRAVVKVKVSSFEGTCSFSDVGYGDAVEYTGSSITPHELAAKEAVSDGIKRCLKSFGDQFGLALYSEEGRAQVAATARAQADAKSTLRQLQVKAKEAAKGILGRDPVGRPEVAETLGIDVSVLDDAEALAAALEALA